MLHRRADDVDSSILPLRALCCSARSNILCSQIRRVYWILYRGTRLRCRPSEATVLEQGFRPPNAWAWSERMWLIRPVGVTKTTWHSPTNSPKRRLYGRRLQLWFKYEIFFITDIEDINNAPCFITYHAEANFCFYFWLILRQPESLTPVIRCYESD